jgi:hypothetical protein
MQDKSKKDGDISFFEKYEFFIILIPLVIILLLLVVFFGSSAEISKLQTCGDSSFYESCSIVKPYYCDKQGFLTEKAQMCSCSDSVNGNSCTTIFQTEAKDINLNYILNGKERNLEFTVYSGLINYLSGLPKTIFYENGGKPIRSDFIFKKINDEEQRKLLMPLVMKIENMTNDKDEQARIAVSIVQNIRYGASNKTDSLFGNSLNHSRYPYEVLYENQGICGEKSELLAFLLRELGYGTVIFYYQLENHEAVGIRCPVEDSYRGTGYCFVETTGPSIITDDSIIYSDGTKLASEPEIILISTGKSLGSSLQEYGDAETMKKIRSGEFMLFRNSKLEKLKERYGLIEQYNLG